MTKTTDINMPALLANEAGYDPIEDRLRENIRATIEAVFEEELDAFLARYRYDRGTDKATGYRHGRRERQLIGTFGTETVSVPRARIEGQDGRITEWRSKALPRYQRLTKKAKVLIASAYLAGNQHAAGEAGAVWAISGRRGQRPGQPRLAQGEGRLGRVGRAQPGR